MKSSERWFSQPEGEVADRLEGDVAHRLEAYATEESHHASSPTRNSKMKPATLRSRQGVASIEYLMFMPVLIGFATATMLVVRMHHSLQTTSLAADTAAAEKAVVELRELRLAQMPTFTANPHPELSQLVKAFQPKLDIRAGLAIGSAEQDTGAGIEPLGIDSLGTATSATYFLASAWEDTVFAFPMARSKQRPLTFPASIRGIAPGMRSLTEFTRLRIGSVSF